MKTSVGWLRRLPHWCQIPIDVVSSRLSGRNRGGWGERQTGVGGSSDGGLLHTAVTVIVNNMTCACCHYYCRYRYQQQGREGRRKTWKVETARGFGF